MQPVTLVEAPNASPTIGLDAGALAAAETTIETMVETTVVPQALAAVHRLDIDVVARIDAVRERSIAAGASRRADPGSTYAVAPCVPQTIELHASAVFQLLLFGATERVRDAAARILAPAASQAWERFECSDADFDTLPLWERTAAMLVATAIGRETNRAALLGLVEPDAFEGAREVPQGQRSERLHRASECRFADCGEDPANVERFAWRRYSFRIPVEPAVTIQRLDLCRRWPRALNPRYRAHWLVQSNRVLLCVAKLRRFHNRKDWSALRLYSPDGVLLSESKSEVLRSGYELAIEIDPALLLRIEAGSLAGHRLVVEAHARYARLGRSQDVVIATEIGASLDDTLVHTQIRGELTPTYPIASMLGRRRVDMPLFDGETLESLDDIAGKCGVLHGSLVCGSFAHHPLREIRSNTRPLAQEAC